MRIALSPCPNDIYLFYGWLSGKIHSTLSIEPTYADIEQLNRWALESAFPLIKLSFACFPKVAAHYQLLPIGAALGWQCGPKLVAKRPFPLSQLNRKRIALPGKETTAHFLLTHPLLQPLLPAPQEKLFCSYEQVVSLVQQETVECGVLIHEARFTYSEAELFEIVDLGMLWQQVTASPLALGGLAVLRSLPSSRKHNLIQILTASLDYAENHPKEVIQFACSYSQEKAVDIVQKHIATYVNAETRWLSDQALAAIEKLLYHPLPQGWIWR